MCTGRLFIELFAKDCLLNQPKGQRLVWYEGVELCFYLRRITWVAMRSSKLSSKLTAL